MLFTAFRGLFFLEHSLKATRVWFMGLSSTGSLGALWGVTLNRAESQPQHLRGWGDSSSADVS